MKYISENKIVNNAYESILQLPGVIEQSGKLSLIGSDNLTVIINGNPTNMTEEQLINLLKNTPVSRIETAEIMRSAQAKYRVRGSAINLVIKKNANDDRSKNITGEINSTYMQKFYANYFGGFNLNYSANNISSYLSYSFDEVKDRNSSEMYSKHTLGDKIYNIDQFNRGYNKRQSHNIAYSLDLDINPKNKIILNYNTSLSPKMNRLQNSTGDFSSSINEKDLEEYMHNISLDYENKSGLKAGLNYTFFKTPSVQNFKNTDSAGDQTVFISNASQKINRLNTYLSNTHQLKDDLSLNYGAEFTYAKDHNEQLYDAESMQEYNTRTKLEEYTANTYLGLDKSFGKITVSLSAIVEYYKLKAYDDWSLYPSLQATYMVSPGNVIQFSVSTNKAFPKYWEIQEGISYLNGYTQLHGNPYLIPSKLYSVQGTYILKSKYILNAYYNRTNDYFMQAPYQSSDDLKLVYQTVNFDRNESLGLTAIFPFSIGRLLNSRLTLDGSYNKISNSDYHNISFQNKKFTVVSRINSTINISSKPEIKLELAGTFVSPSIQGVYDLSSIWSIEGGIKYVSNSKKAEFSIKANDFSNTFVPDIRLNYDKQNLKMHIRPDSRYISVSFVYKFNGYKENKGKSVDTSRFGF